MARVELRDVRKSYGSVDVIKGIDLDIQEGDFCVFVGPSGCGKSTLLRMISGLEPITSGDIVIGDEVVNDIPAADRGLAMVFQSYALYPHMTVRQNLSFGLENINMAKADITAKVDQVSGMLKIDMLLDRRPKDLSGGQRQRVAIGRAIVREPRVYLFDEPLSNLDAELRVDMRSEITALHRRLENTMIYVTHDQVEAMTMADKIAVLRLGKLEQFGRPLELYNRPGNLFVAGFIGSPKMNFLAGRVATDDPAMLELETGEKVGLPTSGFSSRPGQAVTLGIRPNHMRVATDGPVKMEVRSVEQLGGESYIYGALQNGKSLTLHLPGQIGAGIGEVLNVALRMEEAHLFDTENGMSLRQE
jgi:multiple sugar transport system ATP-binding protein